MKKVSKKIKIFRLKKNIKKSSEYKPGKGRGFRLISSPTAEEKQNYSKYKSIFKENDENLEIQFDNNDPLLDYGVDDHDPLSDFGLGDSVYNPIPDILKEQGLRKTLKHINYATRVNSEKLYWENHFNSLKDMYNLKELSY